MKEYKKGYIITNPEWLKPKLKPYHHQISLDCIKKLVDCIEKFIKSEINADTTFKMQRQIISNEIDDEEFLGFAKKDFSEMMGYIAMANLNIRIRRDIKGLVSDNYKGVIYRINYGK